MGRARFGTNTLLARGRSVLQQQHKIGVKPHLPKEIVQRVWNELFSHKHIALLGKGVSLGNSSNRKTCSVSVLLKDEITYLARGCPNYGKCSF